MEENVVVEEKAAVQEKVVIQEKVVVQEKPVAPKLAKSPFLAGILSFLFPFGVGPFYNGETVKGFIFLVIFAGLVSLQRHGGAQPFAGLLMAGFYFYQIIDSVATANRINRRAALTGAEIPEEAVLAPEAIKSGSIFWGILLILIGAALLLGNFGVISYRIIFDFWPIVVIIIGVKLIFDYFSRNRS
jgi:TM2 domain-containing membrane protein YozV